MAIVEFTVNTLSRTTLLVLQAPRWRSITILKKPCLSKHIRVSMVLIPEILKLKTVIIDDNLDRLGRAKTLHIHHQTPSIHDDSPAPTNAISPHTTPSQLPNLLLSAQSTT